MLLFSAHLASAGLTYSTIKAYLSVVRNLHVAVGCHVAYSRALTPRLEQVLRGIKKGQSERLPKHIRLPMTVETMDRIYSVLSDAPTAYNSIKLHSIFGFL